MTVTMDGIPIQGTDTRCAVCTRAAVGPSLGGHPLCARHHGWAAQLAHEYREEVEAAKARRAEREARELARARQVWRRLDAAEGAKSATRVAVGNSKPLKSTYARNRAHALKVRQAHARRRAEERERAVMAALGREGGECSAARLATLTNLSRSTVKRALLTLTRARALRITGRVGGVFYYARRAG